MAYNISLRAPPPRHYADLEMQLQDLAQRRKSVEQKTAYKLDLLSRMESKQREHLGRMSQAIADNNKQADERNKHYLQEINLACHEANNSINHLTSEGQSSGSVRLQQAKLHLQTLCAQAAPQMEKSRLFRLQEKMQIMKDQELQALQRAEILRKERLQQESLASTLEEQRARLLNSLAIEHHEKLEREYSQLQQIKVKDNITEEFLRQIRADTERVSMRLADAGTGDVGYGNNLVSMGNNAIAVGGIHREPIPIPISQPPSTQPNQLPTTNPVAATALNTSTHTHTDYSGLAKRVQGGGVGWASSLLSSPSGSPFHSHNFNASHVSGNMGLNDSSRDVNKSIQNKVVHYDQLEEKGEKEESKYNSSLASLSIHTSPPVSTLLHVDIDAKEKDVVKSEGSMKGGRKHTSPHAKSPRHQLVIQDEDIPASPSPTTLLPIQATESSQNTHTHATSKAQDHDDDEFDVYDDNNNLAVGKGFINNTAPAPPQIQAKTHTNPMPTISSLTAAESVGDEFDIPIGIPSPKIHKQNEKQKDVFVENVNLPDISLPLSTSVDYYSYTQVLSCAYTLLEEGISAGKSKFSLPALQDIYSHQTSPSGLFIQAKHVVNGLVKDVSSQTQATSSSSVDTHAIHAFIHTHMQQHPYPVHTLGCMVLCVLSCMSSILMPPEACLGVMTLDKLKGVYKKHPYNSVLPIHTVYVSMCTHLRHLITQLPSPPAALEYVCKVYGHTLTQHAAPQDKERMVRKVTQLLQLSVLPSDESQPSSPYRLPTKPPTPTPSSYDPPVFSSESHPASPARPSLSTMHKPALSSANSYNNKASEGYLTLLGEGGLSRAGGGAKVSEWEDDEIMEEEVLEGPPPVRDLDAPNLPPSPKKPFPTSPSRKYNSNNTNGNGFLNGGDEFDF